MRMRGVMLIAMEGFDDLFAELKQQSLPTVAPTSELEQVKHLVANLPKISAQLEQPKKKADVITTNDPIVLKKIRITQDELDQAKWFNMKTPNMTAEIKRDLTIIKQRTALDPKRHYKKDKWLIPKQFQMGEIVESHFTPSNGLARKQRGRTLAQELLNDDSTNAYFKRKAHEIHAKRRNIRRDKANKYKKY